MSDQKLCDACKWPLACTFRREVESGYCLIEKRATNDEPVPPRKAS